MGFLVAPAWAAGPILITGRAAGGGPHVKVFDGAALRNLQIVELQSFLAYSPSFTGGVFVGGGNASARPTPQLIAALDRLVGRTALVQPQFASVAVSLAGRLIMLQAGRNGFPVQNTLFFPGVANQTLMCNADPTPVTAVPAVSLGDLHALRTPPFAYQ